MAHLLRSLHTALRAVRGVSRTVRSVHNTARQFNRQAGGGRSRVAKPAQAKAAKLTKPPKVVDPRVASVHAKTRGNLASNPHAYSRKTMIGQKRRVELAKKLREARYKANPSLKKVYPKTHDKNQPTTVAGAISRSKTHGELRRRLLVAAVKSDREHLIPVHGRKRTADMIRRGRKSGLHAYDRQAFQKSHRELIQKAATHLRRKP